MKNNLSKAAIETQVLLMVRNFLAKLEAERAKLAITLDAQLERDLGLGSIERAELFNELEKAFKVSLSQSSMVEAKDLHDVVKAIQEAHPPEKILTEKAAIIEPTEIDPSSAKNLVEVLEKYATSEPNRPHVYLQDEAGKEYLITYGKLYENAVMVAKGLNNLGLKSGETVAIMLPTCAEFFYAFYGTLLAGGLPVPIYPPVRPNQIGEYAKREALILQNAEVRVLITFRKAEGLSKILRTFIPSLVAVTTIDALKTNEGDISHITISATDPALIQYTSGSTGNPKGVLLTHANLLANIHAYGKAIKLKPTDVVVSWLPLYHDMGLIGCWLGSLYYGLPATIMSPLIFLTRPERWLWAIHYHRATISAGPNFAYELCVKKIEDEAMEGLDLNSWRLAFNGAEAIYSKTLDKFVKKFAAYGFKAETFFPVYGLAETCVALTFPPPGRKYHIDRIAREPFEVEHQAVPATAENKDVLEFVACGKPLLKHEIRIVDEEGKILSERRVGSIQFRGPSSMQGYYRNPKATAEIYHEGDWWDSGDLGYIAEEEIYVTGRKKDVIIKAGRNIYPTEVEEVANTVTGIRRGCIVAFGATDAERGTEKLVIVAETHEVEPQNRKKIIANIMEKVTSLLGLPPDQVLLVPPRTIPKTSSGKLRRSATLDAYLKGKLIKKTAPAWWQIAKLFILGKIKNIYRWLPNLGKVFYTTYIGTLFFLTAFPVWLLIQFLSRAKIQKLCRGWANLIIRLSGSTFSISGKRNLLKATPAIYVTNHTSYVDFVIMMAVLPATTLIIVKKELENGFFTRNFVKKLGYLTVNRLDFSQSLADTQQIEIALKKGHSILIFPEGTFTYATGLRPFKLGAFKLAAETGAAICPIGLKGTRKILRSDEHLFRPGRVKVHVSVPIYPKANDWDEVIRLRDLARQEIAKHCGEPSIDLIRAGYEGSNKQ